MAYKNNNPVYNKIESMTESYAGTYEVATYRGVAFKAMFFIALIFIGAFGGLFLMGVNEGLALNLLIVSAFTTFIFALLGLMVPKLSKVFGSLYCLAEGMIIGLISYVFNIVTPGVVMYALLAVIVVLAIVVTLFMTNIVKVNSKFMRFLVIFAISFIVSMILIWIISLITGWQSNPGVTALISGIAVFLATLYLFFDLERIKRIVEGGAPKEMEWFASFGLVYTIAWLYIELLRLIFIILNSRRN